MTDLAASICYAEIPRDQRLYDAFADMPEPAKKLWRDVATARLRAGDEGLASAVRKARGGAS